jgi:hypothetical protein
MEPDSVNRCPMVKPQSLSPLVGFAVESPQSSTPPATIDRIMASLSSIVIVARVEDTESSSWCELPSAIRASLGTANRILLAVTVPLGV